MGEPETCNCTAVRQAARHVTQFYDAALASTGVGVNQYSILAKLGRLGPVSVQDLARHLVMDRSTLGHLLRPLEARGLIHTVVPAEDRRSRLLTLTAAGERLVARARPLWITAQRQFDAHFGPEAAAELRRILRTVTETVLDAEPCEEQNRA